MGARAYTEDERDLVRQLYATHTAAQIAERLHGTGRAAKSVYSMAVKLGLRKWPHHSPEEIEAVRSLHAEGLTDTDIGRRLGWPRESVNHLRRRLGLPKNREAILAAQRRGVESQARTLGVSVGGGLRKLAYRVYAVSNGWPGDCRPREVQILNVLADRGVPLTARELAEAIGMPTTPFRSGKRRILLSSNGPGGTYTADLVRRGLIACLKRGATVHGLGRGRSCHLYLLGPLALSILEERARCQSNATP